MYAVIQDNLSLLDIEKTKFLSFKILDTSSSATLFVTVIGALVVRHQFVLSLRPRLGYKSNITSKQNIRNSTDIFEIWQVSIHNAGMGAAIINGIKYVSGEALGKDNPLFIAQDEVVKELAKHDLIHERDFWLKNISDGFTLPPGEHYILFEVRIEHIEKIKKLDAIIFFQGFLGDSYEREIFFIPRHLSKNKSF